MARMTLDFYPEGSSVLIKATVQKVHIDKDRVTYTLKDGINNIPYQNRFSDKDIFPLNEEDKTDVEDGSN